MPNQTTLQHIALFLSTRSEKEPTKDEVRAFLQRYKKTLELLNEVCNENATKKDEPHDPYDDDQDEVIPI